MPKKPLIAIVDDDPELPAALSSLVRSMGYSAECYSSGQSLLQRKGLAELACVLSDVHMPNMNGFELTRKLADEAAGVPVILMTGRLEPGLEERAFDSGAASFVYKPFGGEELQRKIQDATRCR